MCVNIQLLRQIFMIALLAFWFSGCDPKTTGNTEPPTTEPQPTSVTKQNVCPASEKNAWEAGGFFEAGLVDGGRLIKPWQGHHHSFAELQGVGWTEKEFELLKTLGAQIDFDSKLVRFADNDIATYLNNDKLCPLTIKFLFTYLSENDQKEFLNKAGAHGDDGRDDNTFKKVTEHQDKRFKDLISILEKNPKYHVKFPGRNADQHALGTGEAKKAWKSAKEHADMITHLSALIKDLMVRFPGRISFGMIGDYTLDRRTGNCDVNIPNAQGVPGAKADGTFQIHVWGANAGNFNHPTNKSISGAGQASCFTKQRPGVFGISTMPSGKRDVLMAEDKILKEYN